MSDVLREIVLPKLEGVRKQGGYFMARCPAHDDKTASLSITEGDRGHVPYQPILFNCQAGCETTDILAAMRLSWEILCEPAEDKRPGEWTPWGDAVAVYDYTDEAGRLLFQVLRGPGKRFIQRRPDPTAKSGWAYQLGETRRVLYRLPKIIEAVAGCHMIYVVEGEKDVHSLESAGITATCNPHGAGKWRDDFSPFLRDAIVIIVADRDDPGYAHARQVAASLKGIAAAIEIREPAAGKDVTDHLEAGLTVGQLVMIWQDGDPPPDLAPDLRDFIQVADPPQVFIFGDILEAGDRLMLTGPEGHGKTTLVRQMGLCAACGCHPFQMRPISPRRVLMVDCENSERQSRREFRSLVRHAHGAGWPLSEGMFRLIIRPQGIDLGSDEGYAWLQERVTAHQPELLMIGSLWRLHASDLNEEVNARRVAEAINDARNKVGCAVIVEAHSPHGEGKYRDPRPAGSSLFRRWPDGGLGLMPDTKGDPDQPTRYRLARWRGLRDRSQPWPRQLITGIEGGWPWIAADT